MKIVFSNFCSIQFQKHFMTNNMVYYGSIFLILYIVHINILFEVRQLVTKNAIVNPSILLDKLPMFTQCHMVMKEMLSLENIIVRNVNPTRTYTNHTCQRLPTINTQHIYIFSPFSCHDLEGTISSKCHYACFIGIPNMSLFLFISS